MRTITLLLVAAQLCATSALAATSDPVPKGQNESPSRYKRVPMEFFGDGPTKRERWISVKGLGPMKLAPGIPVPFPPCALNTPEHVRCFEMIDPP
ncbi:MAG: hypothetical protein KBD06_04495 [Candidatus Pacebacteria bacterium]|nr:hypothetical protein [Candidatus Paceibacterota bacterium]